MKQYLKSLDEAGLGEQKTAVLLLSQKIVWLDQNMDMLSCELDGVREQAAKLQESIGKFHAKHSIAAAAEEFAFAQDHFSQAASLMESGIKAAIMKSQNKNEYKALEKPFPLLAVEQELKGMMECLKTVFITIDIGIGKTEEAEGMACDGSHYRDAARGGLWEGGEGDQALLGVLWPMRTLEKLARQARDAAYETAVCVDSMRPVAHSVIKKPLLVQGYFWEKEKQEGQQEAKKLTGQSAKGKPAETKKPSLRKRLQEAEIASRTTYAPAYEKEKKVCEAQR